MTLAPAYRSPRHPAVSPPKLLRWSRPHNYWSATRHPLPCLVFLLPLLLTYELGVIRLGGDNAETIRNGADAWLRWALDSFGFHQLYCAPALLLCALVAWAWWRRADRPPDVVGACSGMVIESVAYALVLWRLSKELGPLFDRLGIVLADGARPGAPALAQLLSFVGAGIYEETLFRLALFGCLWRLARLIHVPKVAALGVAAVLASVGFAAVHHLGPHGEPTNGFVFVFRTLAGLYFTAIFLFRGFGIAVGTHACYDVIVGVAVGG